MTKLIVWTPEFKREVKRLSRKYRKVFDDIERLVDDLETGHLHNAIRLQGVGGAPVFRIRRANSSDNSGKSKGFRIIYFEAPESIYLLDICVRKDCPRFPYRKSDSFFAASDSFRPPAAARPPAERPARHRRRRTHSPAGAPPRPAAGRRRWRARFFRGPNPACRRGSASAAR